MKILGIETSCDETAASVVENGTKIITNILASSADLHTKTGGIIPEVAAREQVRCILPVIERAFITNIDAIAVTVGPGLIGSLLVGVETAKTLSYVWKKPLIPINHLQAHLYANWLEGKTPLFPAVGLVVSGGHTDLVLIKNHHQIKHLGGTRDDAAGECFDKVAKALGLGYPGGPIIANLASKGEPTYSLPRPMLDQDNFDFSFSGLKTSVINLINRGKINKENMAASCQEAIVDCLVEKTRRAAKKEKVNSILLAGGVASNIYLHQRMKTMAKEEKINLYIPPPSLCTDNASFVASCAFFQFRPTPWQKIQAIPGLEIGDVVKYR